MFSMNQVGPEHYIERSSTVHADGLHTAHLSVTFKANKETGNLKLKCIATILNLYKMVDETLLININDEEKSKYDYSEMSQGNITTLIKY